MKKIITFDGVSASGKSTAAKMTANRLGIYYLASGLVYRFSSFIEKFNDINLKEIVDLVEAGNVQYIWDGREPHIIINETDITRNLESNEVANLTSLNANSPEKIIVLNQIIYALIRRNAIDEFTIDGRNVGSALFHNAHYKFYITADPIIRAQRRYEELKKAQSNVTLQQVYNDLLARDERDKNRELYPLSIPDKAIIIDTSHITNKEMLEQILENISLNEDREIKQSDHQLH